jgi:phosphate transport system regulatory protein PhoU
MTQTSSAPTRPFFEEISQLKHELTAEGEAVNVRLARAIEGLMEEDPDLLDDVAVSDADVNAMQISIDNLAFRLLALYQPVAVDLRVIVAAIKINSDLERVGDLAVNIAEAARRYFATGRRIELAFLPRMADIAHTMLTNALQSFVSGNLGLAQSVLERDDALDSLRVQAAHVPRLDDDGVDGPWRSLQPGQQHRNRHGFFLQVEGASIDKQDHAEARCQQIGETAAGVVGVTNQTDLFHTMARART